MNAVAAPASYPRIPHLVPGRGTDDDLVLGRPDRDRLLSLPLEVEEKLDGANVMVWVSDGVVHASGRAGPDSQDRAGQFGRLRAWVASHPDELLTLLGPGEILYGEWLWLTHTVEYHQLPSFFVALDLRLADGTFLDGPHRRDRLCSTGLSLPPLLGTGRYSLEGLEALTARSAWSDGPAEGVVVRPLDDVDPQLRAAKLVRAGFERIPDEAWRQGRPTNRLATGGS